MINEYLSEIQLTKATTTHRSYSYTLKAFIATYPQAAPDDALKFIRNAPLGSRATIAAILSSFYRWQIINERLTINFERWQYLAKQAKGKHRPALHSRLPTEQQIEQVRARCREKKMNQVRYRNTAIVETLLSTGCRAAELCSLTRSSLQPAERRAWIRGKGERERFIYFSPEAWTALQKYLATRRDTNPALFILYNSKIEPMNYATLRHITLPLTPHQFRHYFATRLLESCQDITIVQQALGHSNPATTRIYATLADSKVIAAHRQAFG